MEPTDVFEEVPVEMDRGASLRGIYIRLPVRLISGLKAVAARKELPYQLLVREWLAERLGEERERQLPPGLGDDVIMLRRFSMVTGQGQTPREGWMVAREVKTRGRVRFEAEPWWEGQPGARKTKPQDSLEKAVEEGYKLVEKLWKRGVRGATEVAR